MEEIQFPCGHYHHYWHRSQCATDKCHIYWHQPKHCKRNPSNFRQQREKRSSCQSHQKPQRERRLYRLQKALLTKPQTDEDSKQTHSPLWRPGSYKNENHLNVNIFTHLLNESETDSSNWAQTPHNQQTLLTEEVSVCGKKKKQNKKDVMQRWKVRCDSTEHW